MDTMGDIGSGIADAAGEAVGWVADGAESAMGLVSDVAGEAVGAAVGGNVRCETDPETGIEVHIAESPLDCVALGAGSVLDHLDILGDVLDDTASHF